LQIEIAELRQQQLGSDSSASKNGVEKLKQEYLQKLNLLEDQVFFVCLRVVEWNCFCWGGCDLRFVFNILLLQVSELKMKLGTRSQFSTQRKRVDESTKQLQFEIQGLKAQKVSFLLWMNYSIKCCFRSYSSLFYFGYQINLCLRTGSTAM